MKKQILFKIPSFFIEIETEKAFGIGVVHYRQHEIVWIPKSMVEVVDGGIYVPIWLIAKNNMWDVVIMDSRKEICK